MVKVLLIVALVFPGLVSAQTGNFLSLSVSSPGTFTNTSNNDSATSLLNGISPSNEYHTLYWNYGYSTDAFVGGAAVPAASSAVQVNGLAGYVNSLSPTSNAVAVFGQARPLAPNTHIWGGNFVFDDQNYQVAGTAAELDCNVKNNATTGSCLQLAGAFWNGTPPSFPWIHVSKPLGGTAPTVFSVDDGAATAFFYVADQAPEPLNTDLGSSGKTLFNITDSGNLAMSSGWNGSPSYWWLQARSNNLAPNNATYSIVLNPLGGDVNIGAVSGASGGGVSPDGGGMKHKRGISTCTTSAAVGAVCSIRFYWNTPFADRSYTSTCTGDGIASGVPILQGILDKTPDSLVVQVVALTAVPARFTSIECVAIHD